jgi:hypothetical protein
MRVHEQFPAASTIQPVYIGPVTIGMKSQLITVGDAGRESGARSLMLRRGHPGRPPQAGYDPAPSLDSVR